MKLFRCLGFLIFLLALLNTAVFAEGLIGTKDVKYVFPSGGLSANIYALKDIHGNFLEEGYHYYKPGFNFKLSTFQKDNLLDNSVAAKASWLRAGKGWWGHNFQNKTILGAFYFPSMYSYGTSFEASPAYAIAIKKHWLLSDRTKTLFDFDLNWETGFELCGGFNPSYINPFDTDDSSGSKRDMLMTYWQMWPTFNATLKKPLAADTRLVLSYDAAIQNATDVPIYFLQNYEAGIGLEHGFFRIMKYCPLMEQVIRDQYPYQDERWQGEFNVPLMFDVDLKGEFVIKDNRIYTVAASKRFKALSVGLFVARDYADRKIGFQVGWGGTNANTVGNYYAKRDALAASRSVAPTDVNLASPPDVSGITSLTGLAAVIDSPEKAVWYVANHIDYDLGNIMFDWRTPERVFDGKKGYCSEKAGLQSYLLSQNGYETKLVGFVSRNEMHTVCIYKDQSTGKWLGIDNHDTRLYQYDTQADSPEDFMNMIFPGWLVYTEKQDSGTITKQVDSTTRWYILDWFDRD